MDRPFAFGVVITSEARNLLLLAPGTTIVRRFRHVSKLVGAVVSHSTFGPEVIGEKASSAANFVV
jgi:hypothetical protein